MSNQDQGLRQQRTFEEVYQELTRVVERLEKGGLPLEESLALYERGIALLKDARAILESAKARLEVLAMPNSEFEGEANGEVPFTYEIEKDDFFNR